MRYDYAVSVMGNDYVPGYGWADEHYEIEEIPFGSFEEAVAFCDAITTGQVVDWESKSDCNGLDVVIWEDVVTDDGTYTMEFYVVGEYEWIGAERNLRDVNYPSKPDMS